jgi:hypothetical protein
MNGSPLLDRCGCRKLLDVPPPMRRKLELKLERGVTELLGGGAL